MRSNQSFLLKIMRVSNKIPIMILFKKKPTLPLRLNCLYHISAKFELYNHLSCHCGLNIKLAPNIPLIPVVITCKKPKRDWEGRETKHLPSCVFSLDPSPLLFIPHCIPALPASKLKLWQKTVGSFELT